MSSGPPWGWGRRKARSEIRPARSHLSGDHANDELTTAAPAVRKASTMPRQVAFCLVAGRATYSPPVNTPYAPNRMPEQPKSDIPRDSARFAPAAPAQPRRPDAE